MKNIINTIKTLKEAYKKDPKYLFDYHATLIIQNGTFSKDKLESFIQAEEQKGKNTTGLEKFALHMKDTAQRLVMMSAMTIKDDGTYEFVSEDMKNNLLENFTSVAKNIEEQAKVKNEDVIFKNDYVTNARNEAYNDMQKLINNQKDFTNFLKMSGNLSNLSYANKIMAYTSATNKNLNPIDFMLVKTYDSWKYDGARINKGGKGIPVITPERFPLFDIDEHGNKTAPSLNEDGSQKYGKRFILKSYFDISQTNSKKIVPRTDYDNILEDLVYSINTSEHFEDVTITREEPKEQLTKIINQICINFSEDEMQQRILAAILSSQTKLDILGMQDDNSIAMLHQELSGHDNILSVIKGAMDYSKNIEYLLHLQSIFIDNSTKTIYEYRGNEDLYNTKNTTDYAYAHQKADKIKDDTNRELYLKPFNSKIGDKNENRVPRNSNTRSLDSNKESNNETTHQREETRRVSTQQEQRDVGEHRDANGERLQRERSDGDNQRGDTLQDLKKVYNTMLNVGNTKYVINYHDGIKTHEDGSPFFDINTFSNKKEFEKEIKKLEKDGYIYGNSSSLKSNIKEEQDNFTLEEIIENDPLNVLDKIEDTIPVAIIEERKTPKQKFRDNINALGALNKIKHNETLDIEDRIALSRYTGWGGIPNAFYRTDGTTAKGWENEAEELKSLLEPKEYSELQSTVLSSFYTPAEVTNAIWRAIEKMGYRGGNILEPSCGIGGFVSSMPTHLKNSVFFMGVELDPITAKIAKEINPNLNVYNVGFQNFSSENKKPNLILGNPPFGSTTIEHHDTEDNSYRKLSIHNYFMAKSIDELEDGGICAMVVSNAFLDAEDSTTRDYIYKKADLINAIRLPNTAFGASAHTEVTTDIVFFRKRQFGDYTPSYNWGNISTLNDTPINSYFTYNNDKLLGEWGKFGTMYGGGLPALIERDGQNTLELLNAQIDNMDGYWRSSEDAKKIFDLVTSNKSQQEKQISADSSIKIGSLFIDGDKNVMQRLGDVNGRAFYDIIHEAGSLSDKDFNRIEKLIALASVADKLRKAQIDPNAAEETIEKLRNELNVHYDDFVKEHGYLNDRKNRSIFAQDLNAPFIQTLEKEYTKAVTPVVAKKTNQIARKASAKKAEIFSFRTQYPYQRPTSADTTEDALLISLGEYGRIDMEYISDLVNKSQRDIINELEGKGLIFDDPKDGYVTREEYLSGNVKEKLKLATNPRNRYELEQVIPKDIDPLDISVQLGASWIPKEDINDFLKHITGNNADCEYIVYNADWHFNIEPTLSAEAKWASQRVSLGRILDAAMNNKQIRVEDKSYDMDGRETRVFNEKETFYAIEKMESVKNEFNSWVWQDPSRRERLAKIYNEKFNTTVKREYNGELLPLIGKVDDSVIELRPHQKNAIYRTVATQKVLFDHTVGTGKTYTLIASIMELNRLGRTKKPLIVVPNHLTGQWAKEWLELYPNANILVPEKKDFEKQNRQKLFSKMTVANYDAIIVAHSQLAKIQNDPNFEQEIVQKEIREIEFSIDQLRKLDGKDTRTVKSLQNSIEKLNAKFERLSKMDRDQLISFKDLGIDFLAVDEAHEFKNLQYTTSLNRIGGLGNPEGSKKAFDLFLKTRALAEQNGDKNIAFLTGTPISNTIAEMYTMQRYLDYNNLYENNILHFDAWVKQYAEISSDWELSPAGTYKLKNRLAKFKNVPELMQSYHNFTDVITREQIQLTLAKMGKKLPVPDIVGGKPNNIINERSELQANYIGVPDEYDMYKENTLVWRSENIPKTPEKGSDNMLVIMSDARKCALDMRLINPSYSDNPNSKVNTMLSAAKEQYYKWDSFKGTQLIFCDLSTPKSAITKEKEILDNFYYLADNGTEEEKEIANKELAKYSDDDIMALESKFDVYNDVRTKLIADGIPAKEIAFIHDANTDLQKQELYEKVNNGEIRFLLGSTSKMGAGMNVQKRLVGLHHLDAPWRPSDLEQREGRIIRQGNNINNAFEKQKVYKNSSTKEHKKAYEDALGKIGMTIASFEALDVSKNNFEVIVNRYATKGTLDSSMWQTLEIKARFVEQIKMASFSDREIEDIQLESATSAEMKAMASDNPNILKEMTLRQEIKKLEALEKTHLSNQISLQNDIIRLQNRIDNNPVMIGKMTEDVELAKNIDRNKFFVTIQGIEYEKREEAGEAIMALYKTMAIGDSLEIGTLGDFKLQLEKVRPTFNLVSYSTPNSLFGEGVLSLYNKEFYDIEFQFDQSPQGLATKLWNTLDKPADKMVLLSNALEDAHKQLPNLQAEFKPFPKQEELEFKRAEHREVLNSLKSKKSQESEQVSQEAKDEAIKQAPYLAHYINKVADEINQGYVEENSDKSIEDILKSKRLDINKIKNINFDVKERVVVLPEQLDRNDYLEFDKFSKAFGGEWNKKLQAVVFSYDGISRMIELKALCNKEITGYALIDSITLKTIATKKTLDELKEVHDELIKEEYKYDAPDVFEIIMSPFGTEVIGDKVDVDWKHITQVDDETSKALSLIERMIETGDKSYGGVFVSDYVEDEVLENILNTYKKHLNTLGYEDYEYHYVDDIRSDSGALHHIQSVLLNNNISKELKQEDGCKSNIRRLR